jgi:7,8-dihydropterin-6-yl-methyl-4-(beta-D-ribofuranosyl)aminobenzene 5'-phosphate synthase
MSVTRLYVLSDNKAVNEGFRSEHGLSILIVLGNGRRWLWDVGQSRLFLDSAAKLGLDLSGVEGLALSHGHYDHTDGLAALFKELGFKGPIFAHPSFFELRYKQVQGSVPRRIGLNPELLPWPLPGFTPVRDCRDLEAGLTMFSDIPRRKGLFESVEGYSFDIQGNRPDFVRDDACLVVETAKGPVLVLGCCHSGLANTLHHISQVKGFRRFHAVIGGLHLLNAPEAALKETPEICRQYLVERLYPCHCTGDKAIMFLKENLPGTVFDVGTGSVIEF